LLIEAEQKRQQACLIELDAVLKKHGYRLNHIATVQLAPVQGAREVQGG